MSEETVDYSQYGLQVGEANVAQKSFRDFKIEEGSNVYRLLPPLGEQAAKGIWNVGHAVHWGYKNGKGKMRCFECIEKKDPKTKMILSHCPECDRIAEFKKTYDDKLLQFKAEFGEEKAKKKLKPYEDHLRTFNRSFGIYVNAMNEKGEVGALRLNVTHMQLFRMEAGKLDKRGINPIALNSGAWFDFLREGNKTFKCDIVRNDDDTLKNAAVPVAVLKRLKDDARDLTSLFRVLSKDQIQSLVDSDGAPEVVDSIFGGGEAVDSEDGAAGADEVEALAFGASKVKTEEAEALPKAAKQEKPVPVTVAAKDPEQLLATGLDADDDVIPETFKPNPGKKPVEPVANASGSVASMSNDAFKALIGKK